MFAASSISLTKVVDALNRAGIELIGDYARSDGGRRGVRLKEPPPRGEQSWKPAPDAGGTETGGRRRKKWTHRAEKRVLSRHSPNSSRQSSSLSCAKATISMPSGPTLYRVSLSLSNT